MRKKEADFKAAKEKKDAAMKSAFPLHPIQKVAEVEMLQEKCKRYE